MKLVYSQPLNSSKKDMVYEMVLAAALSAVTVFVFFSMFSIPVFPLNTSMNFGGELVYVWNFIAECLGQRNYILLPKFESSATGAGSITILITMILFILNYLIIRSRLSIFLIIYILPFLLFPLIWNIYPEIWYSILFMCILVIAFSHMTSQRSLSIKTTLSFILIFTITFTSIVLTAPDDFIKPPAAQNAEKSVDKIVRSIRYGDTLLGGEDLSKLGSRKKSDESALKITMETPESLYLRGFVGSRLTNRGWENLSDSDYYKDTSLYYWLHEYGFSGLSQMQHAAQFAKSESKTEAKENTIEIENIDTDRSHIYMPYEVINYSEVDDKTYSDSFLKPKGMFGNSGYSFSAAHNLVSSWPEMAAQIFTHENTDALEEYKRLESHYNVNVYDNYTEISDSYIKLFSGELKKVKTKNKEHTGYKEAIKNIKEYFEENFIYTETVNPSKEKDFVKNFIESKKGYDVHYATAATAMFRYYGIPARYVEGYLITPDNIANKNNNSTIDITDKNLHAWTEIYVDVLGWVPMEVTPEYYGVMEDPDMEKGLEDISVIDEFNQNQDQLKKKINITEKDDIKQIQFPWIWLAKVALILILLFLLWLIKTKYYPKLLSYIKRKKAFKHKDPRKAVCAIYAYMMEKYEITDHTIDNHEIKKIGERAAYSKHEITEEHRQYMLGQLKGMKGEQHDKITNSKNK